MMSEEILNQKKIDDWRWQIVCDKNSDFDNVFYTGVRSTNIYCKPSCPARRPNRENVLFFGTREEAERSGFRACLRCRPNLENAANPNAELVKKVCELISRDDEQIGSLENLSSILNVSPAHLQRTFKNALGVSPKEFADARRLENFKREVKQSDVTTALYESGFNSSRALYEKAGAQLGMTPATYRRNGKGLTINFTITDCRLGKLLIAATSKGICSIKFGDNLEELEKDLKQEFSAAETINDASSLQMHVAAVLEVLNGQQKNVDLPLDVRATAFQLRVWQELRKIPIGETRSYKQIAESLGNAKAVRAVARACASNPVALLTPCHRVIGSDSNLTGYRWGVERKKELLEQEKKFGENTSK